MLQLEILEGKYVPITSTCNIPVMLHATMVTDCIQQCSTRGVLPAVVWQHALLMHFSLLIVCHSPMNTMGECVSASLSESTVLSIIIPSVVSEVLPDAAVPLEVLPTHSTVHCQYSCTTLVCSLKAECNHTLLTTSIIAYYCLNCILAGPLIVRVKRYRAI